MVDLWLNRRHFMPYWNTGVTCGVDQMAQARSRNSKKNSLANLLYCWSTILPLLLVVARANLACKRMKKPVLTLEMFKTLLLD